MYVDHVFFSPNLYLFSPREEKKKKKKKKMYSINCMKVGNFCDFISYCMYPMKLENCLTLEVYPC